jgi:hypothetical protein
VHTSQIVLYLVLGVVIFAGIAFLIYTLIHMVLDSHQKPGAAQSVENGRWRR